MVRLIQRRGLRRTSLGLVLLLLLLAAGRMGQVYLESRPQGARGPYLQMPAPDGMTIRWQTLAEVPGEVRYGTAPDALDGRVEGPVSTLHELRLTGLRPDTSYYYSVGEVVHAFRTSPQPGTSRPVRLWVQGDPGRANELTLAGRDAVLAWGAAHPRAGLPPIDLWLTTGDNAYRSGKDEEFQRQLFDAYPALLPTVPYLPVYGNHDARRNAFYQLFTFPTEGESGGVASGSGHYFAVDYGPVHLLFLDSQATPLEREGEMLKWLERDLEATRQPWLIALLHHPAYSRGSHDSDNDGDSGGRMRRVRENVLPLLEHHGADLVLFGHSHVYERTHLMACHYGKASSLKPPMQQQRDDGHYTKPAHRGPLSGTVYSVVGSTANADKGPLDHPAMAVGWQERGSLMLDIAGDTLSGYFITPNGEVRDNFRITRTAGGQPLLQECP